ncbi:MAG: DUF885 domain-containing protein [Candidatus Dormiibacterota bacterium]
MTRSSADLLDGYLRQVFDDDPILATNRGDRVRDGRLPVTEPEALAASRAWRQRFVRELGDLPPTDDPQGELDRTVARLDAEAFLAEADAVAPQARCPYWYVERLGDAINDLLTVDSLPQDVRADALVDRMRGGPRYLDGAERALDSQLTPPAYVDMGIEACVGLAGLLSNSVPAFASANAGVLGRELEAVATRLGNRLQEFLRFLNRFRDSAQGTWRSGRDRFDWLLKNEHLLPLDALEVAEIGAQRMEEELQGLAAAARRLDPDASWRAVVRDRERRHPDADSLLDAYRAAVERARQHTVEAALVSIPAEEECRLAWLPDYLRSSLPMGVMKLSPPFDTDMLTTFFITRPEGSLTPAQMEAHLRSHSFPFIESIAGHETYPGHHLQRVHHKAATQRSPIRRYLMSSVMIEGWGLYVESLQVEGGFPMNPGDQLFRARNRLWRAARLVIDTGLHAGSMTFDEAVTILTEKVGLGIRMAQGEVRRYQRHDNPTYPSSYLLGADAIARLRDEMGVGPGAPQASIRSFHDRFLGFGSVPVSLIANMLRGQDPRSWISCDR